MSELECSICLGVLAQPMQLPCGKLVCATCLVEWIHLCAARCPCCHSTAPLECKDVNPASSLIQQLLHDVMVVCGTCMKAISYDSHCCTTVQRQEMKLVSKVLHQMLNANDASILSAGAEDADILFEDELRCLSEERKEKQAGVYLGSERKQHALSNKLVHDNLEVELAPFSFQLSNGGEERLLPIQRDYKFKVFLSGDYDVWTFWCKCLFEEACHQLDLKLAMHWEEDSINSSEYEAYSNMLSNLSAAKCELDSLQEEEIIQQVAIYYSIVDGSNELLATGFL
ncbi:hypothetical protein EMCRGX_G025963 [Ephydatia muelleri]